MTPPTPRRPLSRPAVLEAAVALADTEGIEAVSMRRLSETLGVVPMALYKHVADKKDLLDGMVDAVIAEFTPPPTDSGPSSWRDDFAAAVDSARLVQQRHPWSRRAMETRTLRTPRVLGHMEALTQVLLGAGFSPDLAHHAMHALGNRIWGFSPELFKDPTDSAPTRRSTSPTPDPADFPGILAVVADAGARRPGATGCDEDFEFRFALDLLLEGLARLHERGWSSPTT